MPFRNARILAPTSRELGSSSIETPSAPAVVEGNNRAHENLGSRLLSGALFCEQLQLPLWL
jgi:hypothetical protein